MANETEPTLTPKLRFPQFREDPRWSEKPLATLGQFTRGLTYSSDDVTPEGLLVLRSTNIQDGTLVLHRDLVFVGKECPPALRLRKGDIAICMSNGSKALVGKSAEYAGNYPADLTVGAFCSFFRPSVSFAKLAFQSNEYERYVGDLIAGGNINNLTNSVLEEFCFPIPPAEAEQQKIAECLSTLDELMTAESQKLDALKAHKKGLMQQLFPREGETLPRRRFPEFQDAPEWAADKLGLACELYQPVTLSASELSMTGEYLVYGANGVIGSHKEFNHEDSEIAVTCRGATCGEVTRTEPRSWITGNAMVVRPSDDRLSRDFIFHYFKNHGLKSVISGSAQPQITRAGFAPLLIVFPKPDEQHRIASCLSSVDDLIAAQSDQLEALKTHKKGLMQQLFPSPVEAAE